MPQTAPDPNVLLRERRDRREQILADRAGKGTARMYGDGTRGATGHFMGWCKAKPGETYLGVTMPADKEVYSGAAHHKTIELFLGQWVVKRPLLDKKGKPIPGTEGGLSKESVKAYVKALSDLQKGQKTQEEFMDEVRDAEKPCESREVRCCLSPGVSSARAECTRCLLVWCARVGVFLGRRVVDLVGGAWDLTRRRSRPSSPRTRFKRRLARSRSAWTRRRAGSSATDTTSSSTASSRASALATTPRRTRRAASPTI
mmetsp:Transcript_8744/g.36200  ORF Transcript_8744/g.36200 Transcript_8744/m.36200 type:complete len:258 (-) Transcript_8744:2253-3026(-)